MLEKETVEKIVKEFGRKEHDTGSYLHQQPVLY